MDAGCDIVTERDAIRLKAPNRLKAVSVRTAPLSRLPDRHAGPVHGHQRGRRRHRHHPRKPILKTASCTPSELMRLGADIRSRATTPSCAASAGLKGAKVMATDLRAARLPGDRRPGRQGGNPDRSHHLDPRLRAHRGNPINSPPGSLRQARPLSGGEAPDGATVRAASAA